MRLRYVVIVSFIVLGLGASLAMGAAPHKVIGSDKCKLCHKVEFASWSTTKHAKAWDSLKPAEQSKPDCVKCHSTDGTKAMPGVGCEACHGPGSDYKTMAIMKDKQKAHAAGLIEPTEAVCVKCHNKQSPTFKGFNFAEAVKNVHDKKKK